jgi:hypothetical protein
MESVYWKSSSLPSKLTGEVEKERKNQIVFDEKMRLIFPSCKFSPSNIQHLLFFQSMVIKVSEF